MLTFIKVLPANYSPSENIPLIAFFPGHKGTALKFKKLFAGEQAKRRFIGVYFNTPDGGWNIKDHWHEIQEILIDAADNTSGWYAVGVSNGACLALQMQWDYVLIGVAAFAGSLFVGDSTGTSATRKTIMFNGKKDDSVKYNGGESHKVDMMGALKTFTEMAKGKEIKPMLRGHEDKLDYYYTVNQDIRLYGFDLYGHDVYSKVSKELGWNLPELCLNFFGITKIPVK